MIASPKELSYFLEVCHTLNFSRASERLGISQPSLSNAIKRLEHAIGCPLFIRSKLGVNLTQAGKQLQMHGKELVDRWEDIKAQSLHSHERVQGCFRLGCHSAIGLYLIPQFLPQLLQNHPTLEIQLNHALSRKIVEAVIQLRIDIAIVVNPIKHPDLILQKLYNDKVCFWQAKGKEVNTKTIICDPNLIQTQVLLKQLEKKNMAYHRIIESTSLEVITRLTEKGVGMGIIPTSIANNIAVTPLSKKENLPSYQDEIYLAYRPENKKVQAIQVINQAIKQFFKTKNS